MAKAVALEDPPDSYVPQFSESVHDQHQNLLILVLKMNLFTSILANITFFFIELGHAGAHHWTLRW